jgi:hypothetical protein
LRVAQNVILAKAQEHHRQTGLMGMLWVQAQLAVTMMIMIARYSVFGKLPVEGSPSCFLLPALLAD